MNKDGITLNDERLTRLIAAFSGVIPEVRVGIMGSGKNTRADDSGSTNAEIGAAHEFGTTKLPRRSFLRMPLSSKLKGALIEANFFDKEALNRVIEDRSIDAWMKKIGIVALDVVLGAFASGGYGKWEPSNMAHKKVQMTLVESQQLRNSITYEVVG